MIFSDKSVRRFAAVLALLLLAMLIAGQLITVRMAQDYKQGRIEHDYAAAGALLRSGADPCRIVAAFTTETDEETTEAGASLLSAAGYDASTQNSLLPAVKGFHLKYALMLLAFSLLFSAALFAVLYFNALNRNRRLEAAAGKLRSFIDGDASARLEDCGEGSLSGLFFFVNMMATSLTAHIEKEQKNKEFLKDTISDISHQLKTPLAALSMYNEIISDENTGNEVIESFTGKSRRELDRMEVLIQNLLRLARLDAGTVELERSACNLRDFLESCISSFTTRAEQEGKGISLVCDDSATLCLDETWFGEAVGNIIKNALDHTKSGDNIEVSCEKTAVATEIVIRDNGSGIHPEDLHHIFKRFYRSRYSKDKQGVGIGLSLAKVIVEGHGGVVTVESELGRGTEFRLIFPKLTEL